MRAYATGSLYHPAKHRVKCALWVVRRSRPYSIIEDPELREIFQDLNSRVETPSRRTLTRDTKEIFEIEKENLRDYLAVRVMICMSSLR
jgi:hypothetical protein